MAWQCGMVDKSCSGHGGQETEKEARSQGGRKTLPAYFQGSTSSDKTPPPNSKSANNYITQSSSKHTRLGAILMQSTTPAPKSHSPGFPFLLRDEMEFIRRTSAFVSNYYVHCPRKSLSSCQNYRGHTLSIPNDE